MSAEQQDIRHKLEQIQDVVTILKAMDVPDLPYTQWLDGQLKKNQPLTGANETELSLKQEVHHELLMKEQNVRQLEARLKGVAA